LLPVSVIECPGCGEDEDLSGDRRGDPGSETITVTCGACGLVWDRDLTPRCPTCRSDDVRTALRSIVDKSRGTQLSIQSMQVVHLCRVCDAEQLAVWNRSNTPLAPTELPFDPD
jgi:transcription elongation factor Elf1